jgi:hypothetical protein
MRAENNANGRIVFDKDEICRCHRDATTGEADDQETPLPVHYTDALVENVTAYGLEHDVDARSASSFFDAVAQTARLVIYELIRAVFGREFKLVRAASSGDNPRAEPLSDFDSGKPNATAGARHK